MCYGRSTHTRPPPAETVLAPVADDVLGQFQNMMGEVALRLTLREAPGHAYA